MTKEKLIQIAERNLIKARKSMEINYNRQGVTEIERENLSNNVKFAEIVCGLIKVNAQWKDNSIGRFKYEIYSRRMQRNV